MNIKQIEIKNFRSINSGGLTIENLEKYNLFIGKNNSGKSNIIKIIPFLGDLFRNLPKLYGTFSLSVNNSYSQAEDLFYKNEKEIYLSVTFSFEDKEKEILISGLQTSAEFSIFRAELFNISKNILKISFKISQQGSDKNKLDYSLLELKWDDLPLIDVARSVLRRNTGNFSQDKFNEDYSSFEKNNGIFNYIFVMLHWFGEFSNQFRIIKAVRKIGGMPPKNMSTEAYSWFLGILDIDGDRTIDIISTLRSPNDSVPYQRSKYKKLNSFISDLMGIKVELVVPEDKKQIFIEPVDENDGITLPYKSWGSSLEELIVLIVDILYSPENSIIALEEPEIHLDVALQKRFITFLKERTDHQYLISSHSNILINSFNDDKSSIFRVSQKDDSTEIEKADENVLQNVLDDLGIKASDILQTNGVIWVEGPSDRIFINKWISLLNSEFIEGIHYSIMFYGGRLLNHLSVNNDISETEREAETNKFIELIKLNRNIAVVIDSDKKNEGEDINSTKKRIEKEIKKYNNRAFCWITDGREIENYIPPLMFKDILGIDNTGKYTKVTEIDKKYVKIDGAEKLVKNMMLDIFEQSIELREKMDLLVERIKLWNQ